MTVLVIDAGNTRIKWGIADASGWLRRAWLDTADAAGLGDALQGVPVPSRRNGCRGAPNSAAYAAAMPIRHNSDPTAGPP